MRYVHVGINVTDLEKSIEFYEKVFGESPVKVKMDYAKFLLETLGLNFTLNVRDEVKGNQVNHFGFQVDTAEEIMLHKERLEKEGFFARDEMDTTCCYAVQDKFWVTDPDGNEWEFFYTKAQSDVHKIEESSCCTTSNVVEQNSCC
ncbi:TPA: ArsI/CadI family heavy metal resistance metalloenzyme [Bacillus thuringiensis]|uniref:ArsI/CadI family heavy metal resistance metalloenzyme n=1 Tax=Bacillus sp. SRB3LM TaxID=2608689 RepID=UPI0018C40463|nr:ArsI/CadI family heavy metal resistance metalloenzyme [Bacillus sp. SRB3LM]MCU4844036.1 glyoxalase/bleomycin resistance/dioxygenase family protein [Bacillus cereus]MBG0967930.1 glyoxalase/bleomycin resistance/dioxygenase family protein [Bacillus sp. SRB3LM]HDR4764161.1 glyoxalase/bleomycin resistance/dioxygenase family protein [Bacillus cereus]HDR4796984.1 glyoxalase/bleomycin resistance/dioxygenase family protein [Bacillus cereus]HDR4799916.1 glyoxalase/bleomycin resistance/dioxygenase fam